MKLSVEALRRLRDERRAEVSRLLDRARRLIEDDTTWEDLATRIRDLEAELEAREAHPAGKGRSDLDPELTHHPGFVHSNDVICPRCPNWVTR